MATDHRHQATRARPQIAAHEVARRRRAWIDWVTTVDHKKIGIMYMVTAFVFFLVGGIEALLMRLQLGAPEQHVPGRRRTTTSCSRCTGRR